MSFMKRMELVGWSGWRLTPAAKIQTAETNNTARTRYHVFSLRSKDASDKNTSLIIIHTIRGLYSLQFYLFSKSDCIMTTNIDPFNTDKGLSFTPPASCVWGRCSINHLVDELRISQLSSSGVSEVNQISICRFEFGNSYRREMWLINSPS